MEDLAFELESKDLRIAYKNLEEESRKARYLKDLTSNANEYYSTNSLKVTKSLQNFQIIKQLLEN